MPNFFARANKQDDSNSNEPSTSISSASPSPLSSASSSSTSTSRSNNTNNNSYHTPRSALSISKPLITQSSLDSPDEVYDLITQKVAHHAKLSPPLLNIPSEKKKEKSSDFIITTKEKKPDSTRALCSTPTSSATIASPKLNKNFNAESNNAGKLIPNSNSKTSNEFYLNDQSLKGLGSVSEFLLNQLNQNQKFLQTSLKISEPVPIKTQVGGQAAKLSSSHKTDLRQMNPPMKAELYESPMSMLRENSTDDSSENPPVPPIRTKIKRFIPVSEAPKSASASKSVSPRHIEINKNNENNLYANHKQVSPASSLSSSPSSSSPGSTTTNTQSKPSSKSEFYYLNKNNDDSSASSNAQIEPAKTKASAAKAASRQGIFLDFDNLEYKVKTQDVQHKQPNSQFVSPFFCLFISN